MGELVWLNILVLVALCGSLSGIAYINRSAFSFINRFTLKQ